MWRNENNLNKCTGFFPAICFWKVELSQYFPVFASICLWRTKKRGRRGRYLERWVIGVIRKRIWCSCCQFDKIWNSFLLDLNAETWPRKSFLYRKKKILVFNDQVLSQFANMWRVLKSGVWAEKPRRSEHSRGRNSVLEGCSLLTLKCSFTDRDYDPWQILISMILITKAAWPGWKLLPVIQTPSLFYLG